ncbi:zinc ribbon domain-containing protein [Geosporobacter ferrireducens]|uniref:Uncharacterized protein n=1 Tax=Geosporobacter ferrireducens TaxID=1424294 RepID=A0A1D8GMS9_9FIRM|nr:zinc ribbon domain-containing protein [Geosporobacter ferrireducens]AOT72200.1 hypothetical protein Gferi_23245 [Geosporobacter ferrireducens]MTI56092.1 hypothetical protein [Geosporobacter ferrireducens]
MKQRYPSQKEITIRTCRKCREAIPENALYDYCPKCFKRIDEVFTKIRDYLAQYPGATSFEMEQELGIPHHIISNFVREGRLVEIPNDYVHIECKGCGCLLLSAHHKFCPSCRSKLEAEIESAKNQLKKVDIVDKAKMHIRHK